jgi:hypothetical protein
MSKNEPPIFEDPEDEAPVDEVQLKRLQKESHEFGLHIQSNDPIELEAILTLARQERGADHPVPCYGLSYDPTDRRCRVCHLRGKCSELDTSPRIEVMDLNQLQPVICEVCHGSLEVELLDKEDQEVRDYGCTTEGCMNTLGVQCGWENNKADVVRSIVLPDDQKKEEKEKEAESEPADDPSSPPLGAESPASPQPASKKTTKKKTSKKKRAKNKAAKKKAVKKPKPQPKPKEEPKPKERPKTKVVVKKASKKAKSKPKAKEPAKVIKLPVRTAATPKGGNNKSKLLFSYNGQVYVSLTAIAVEITGTRSWSGPRFFKAKTAKLAPGAVLTREFGGNVYEVTVIKG